MSTPVAMTIGLEEAVRIICRELERFAAPGKLPSHDNNRYPNLRRHGDIDIFFDMKKVGHAQFHFVTWDNCEANVVVDFTKMDRAYLANLVKQVEDDLNRHRSNRGALLIEVTSTDVPIQ